MLRRYTEGIVNYALSIEGVQMAAFIREDEKKVKCHSSKGTLPVNEFSAQNFDGGHRNAAGGISFESMKIP